MEYPRTAKDRLAQQERLSTAAIQDAIGRLGLGRSVLYDLVRRHRRRPQTSSLLPWKRGRGPRVPVLAQEREELLPACIREFYLTPERPSLAALGREVRRRFAERQLSSPHYRTIQRRAEGLDLRLALQNGKDRNGREKVRTGRLSSLGADLSGPRPD